MEAKVFGLTKFRKIFPFLIETQENKYTLLITKENTSFFLYHKFKFHITLLTEAKYALRYTYRKFGMYRVSIYISDSEITFALSIALFWQ